ncbi:MAG TPA: hypothetical protein VF669_14010 [Tepidisphaeraceae bacterium]|jgi:hypothetical protein
MAQSSPNKKKATASANARKKATGVRGAPQRVRTGTDQTASQSRFKGETPLTGEDRPASRSGGKKKKPSRKEK